MKDILEGFTMWIDGEDYGLEVETVTIPFPQFKKATYLGGGMAMATDQYFKTIDPMEVSIKMAGQATRLQTFIGIKKRVTFRGAVMVEADGSVQKHICVAEGKIAANGRDAWSRGEKVGTDFTLGAITYLRYEIDSTIKHELQAWPPMLVIDGVNHLSAINPALGYA